MPEKDINTGDPGAAKWFVPAAALAAGLFTFVVYLKAITFDFVYWDDDLYILYNPAVRMAGWKPFVDLLTKSFAGNWHPLTMLSYKLDHMLWGLDPMGYHLTNVVLHCVATGLVFVFSHELTVLFFDGNENRARRIVASAFCALLFGIHPLHVESVAWISERKDLLSTIFFLVSLLFYLRYRTGKTESAWKLYVLSLISFALALMCKAMVVTLPVVLLILDFYPLRKLDTVKAFFAEVWRKTPFIVLSVLVSIVAVHMQGTYVASLEYMGIGIRVINAVQTYVFYLEKTVFPKELFHFYQELGDLTFFSIKTVSSIFILSCITAVSIFWYRKRSYVAVVWAYYLVTLLPVIGLVKVGSQTAADRYMYIPSIGLFLFVGCVLAYFAGQRSSFSAKAGAVSAAVIITALLTVKTSTQLDVWRDDGSLWTNELKYAKSVSLQQLSLIKRGSYFYRLGMYNEAISDYTNGLIVNPGVAHHHVLRGDAFAAKGEFARAQEDYKLALELSDGMNIDAYLKLETLYAEAGMTKKAEYYKILAQRVENGERLSKKEVERAAARDKAGKKTK